jgi:hypothetical protein
MRSALNTTPAPGNGICSFGAKRRPTSPKLSPIRHERGCPEGFTFVKSRRIRRPTSAG